jgi:sec-independent protein translocase protein TatB|tara:strand:- start:1131 stop:1364 length:234 start_codon:yes stop_codon:yes gene_type:complete
MPQIGWLEILIIVILAIIIIGPKDVPVVLRKIGNWISKLKTTFTQLQNDITEIEDTVEKEISFEQDLSKKNNDDGKK